MTGWTVIVPAKPWHLAKSRLGTRRRAALAQAFCLDVLDTLAATAAVERVVVVSAEPTLITEGRRRGFAVLADRPLMSRGQLDAAVDLGRTWARREAPRDPVAVVPADLPCLRPTSLAVALARLAAHDRAYVPDPTDGTTLVTAARPSLLISAYGSGSDERHERLGLARVSGVPLGARRDVDTVHDLADALALGVGPHTQAAVRQHPLLRPVMVASTA